MIESKDHIIPKIESWPITKFSNDKEAFIEKLCEYAFNRIKHQQKLDVEDLLDKTIFLENKRTSKPRWKVDPQDEKNYWKKLRTSVRQASQYEDSEEELDFILKKIINRYAVEIVGSFHPKTFKFARKFLRSFFKRLYNDRHFFRVKDRYGSYSELLSKIKVYGHVDEMRALFDKGTVVVVPTHFSNLDSILIGYALDAIAGVPAFIYGAGLNLYNNEIIAYYMNRMGTYRVDRRKKNRVYIETLKSMTTLSLIEGVNNLFFPGGTRSRSGGVENSVKYGLLNSVVEAQRYCIQKDIDRKIFLVPLTTSYPCVLDAKSLIHDYLTGFGKEKYNSPVKKRSVFKIFMNYLKKTRNVDTYVCLNFGKPLDVFGNHVDEEGRSLDSRDKPIEVSSYFKGMQGPETKVQREYVYTKKLAEKLIQQFKNEKIILPSNILSFVAFRIMMLQKGETDLFSFLRSNPNHLILEADQFIKGIELIKNKLQDLANQKELILYEHMPKESSEILDLGYRHLGIYHIDRCLKKVSNNVFGTEDLSLLYYYHNQLTGYNLEEWFDNTWSESIVETKDTE